VIFNYRKMLVMGAFGFSSGLPYILIFSTLTAWLRDVDISLSSIGFFAWISLTYSLKFLWSPFVDRFPIPFLAKYGKRKSWIIVAQLAIFLSLLALSAIDPKNNISLFILFAFFIAFSGSIQDIAIDAFRIEYAEIEDQGNLAAAYQFGYRLAILVATSLALILADSYGWSKTYEVMAALMCLGFIGVFISKKEIINDELEKLNFLESFVEPLKDFGSRFGVYLASMLLLIVATYRLTDIVMGPMANPFYLDMGYTLTQIGSVVKIVALGASIVGIFIGGILIKRISLYYSLVTGAFLVMLTNLCFSYVAITNEVFFQFGFVSIPIKLSFIVGLDSIAAGIVGTVNITFLTSLVSKKYTAVQYALLSSFMMLPGKIFSGFSGQS
jgi:PAT family beta-lactamase induction signal transducer AmpG